MDNLRRRVSSSSAIMYDGSTAEALDVLFSSNDGTELILVRGQANWPDSGYTPVGIVVVPGTHNRYGDGSCGIMSLKTVHYTNSSSGYSGSGTSSPSYIQWGHKGTVVGNNIFLSTSALEKTNLSETIPLQFLADYSIRVDNSPIWPYALERYTSSAYYYTTGEAITEYYNSGSSGFEYVSATSGKAACDFNGVRNTAAIYVDTKTQSEWLFGTDGVSHVGGTPFSTITGCAAKYKPLGTLSFLDVYGDITENNINYGTSLSSKPNKGFWYLPAMGELTYIYDKAFEIVDLMKKLNLKYSSVALYPYIGNSNSSQEAYYWSSSEHSANYAWFATFKLLGYVAYKVKDTATKMTAYAFMRF